MRTRIEEYEAPDASLGLELEEDALLVAPVSYARDFLQHRLAIERGFVGVFSQSFPP